LEDSLKDFITIFSAWESSSGKTGVTRYLRCEKNGDITYIRYTFFNRELSKSAVLKINDVAAVLQ